MPHYHNCNQCGVQVSHCSDDSCQAQCKTCGQHHQEGEASDHDPDVHPNYGKHYCSQHHPDPQFRVNPTPPLKR